MSQLVQLPEVLLYIIKEYLSNEDSHYFLNTSKSGFNELKKKTIYFNLTSLKSLSYYHDPIFQNLLLSKVENGWKQISLQFERIPIPFNQDLPIHKIRIADFTASLSDISHIECIRTSIEVDQIPPIPKVKELAFINGYELTDVSPCSHLSKLEIKYSSYLSDITPLKDIPDLRFNDCDSITDYSMLNCTKQQNLQIKFCSQLKNVDNFRWIRTIELTDCHALQDVSPLNGVYDLSISYCSSVRDISGLGNHYKIYIANCSDDLFGYESLLHVPHIRLAACNIVDLSCFRYAKSVHLYDCVQIVDCSPIKHARKVILDGCAEITNLSELVHVYDLSLLHLIQADKIGTPCNVRFRLFDSIFCAMKDYNFLYNIKYLTICPNIQFVELIHDGKIDCLRHLLSLTIQECGELQHVHGLGEIPAIKLVNCNQLRDISGLGRNRSVEIENCPVEDVGYLKDVQVVTIIKCSKIKDFTCLLAVPRLKIFCEEYLL